MRKPIFVLATAGVLSGAALAQSNVTIYGIADMAYVYEGNASQPDAAGTAAKHDSSALQDGGWDSSRFGITGSEDLGNGLSAKFLQEFNTTLDYGSTPTLRHGNVSLASKTWGEIKLGSFGSVEDDYAGFSEAGGMSWGNGVVNLDVTEHAYNAIEYISPVFSGLQFKLGASSNYKNTQDSDTGGNDRAVFGSVAYVNGPLRLALTYDDMNQQSTAASRSEWMAVAGYDFGPVKVGAGYDRADADTTADGSFTRDAYRLTIGAAIGTRGAVALSYTNGDLHDRNNNVDYDASGWGVSYSYFLSKRTALYAAGYVADAKDGYFTTMDDSDAASSTYSNYQNGFKMGVRHTF